MVQTGYSVTHTFNAILFFLQFDYEKYPCYSLQVLRCNSTHAWIIKSASCLHLHLGGTVIP